MSFLGVLPIMNIKYKNICNFVRFYPMRRPFILCVSILVGDVEAKNASLLLGYYTCAQDILYLTKLNSLWQE